MAIYGLEFFASLQPSNRRLRGTVFPDAVGLVGIFARFKSVPDHHFWQEFNEAALGTGQGENGNHTR